MDYLERTDAWICAQKTMNAFKNGIIESAILKRAFLRFWRKFVKNIFVFCANRYIFLQREDAIPHAEARLLTAHHRFRKGIIPVIKQFLKWTDARDT
jgi:hypothetical protein